MYCIIPSGAHRTCICVGKATVAARGNKYRRNFVRRTFGHVLVLPDADVYKRTQHFYVLALPFQPNVRNILNYILPTSIGFNFHKIIGFSTCAKIFSRKLDHAPLVVMHRQYGTACRMTLELHHLSLSFEGYSERTISSLPFNILLWF